MAVQMATLAKLRSDNVGSLVRTTAPRNAFDDDAAGRIAVEELGAAEESGIRMAEQESQHSIIVDGGYRRRVFTEYRRRSDDRQ